MIGMCFYDQTRYSCGDWNWGKFAAKCNHEYRMGETCGMKLVNVTHHVGMDCKICEKIRTKYRRRDSELEKLARWRREGSVLKASMEKAQLAVTHLEQEILHLECERQNRQMAITGR
jgi:hypothetical protein